MPLPLRHIVLIFESRAHWVDGRVQRGWSEEDAKVASYWLLADEDVPVLAEQIAEAAPHIQVHTYEIDQIDEMLDWLNTVDRSSIILWNVSDGLKRFRGALVPGLARLLGVAYFGSPVASQALAQDRFKLSAVAREAGVPVPRGFLVRGDRIVSAPHTLFEAPRYFVKTNSFGNKVGLSVNAVSTCLQSALEATVSVGARFKDECLVQEYLPGMELRVSYLEGGRGMEFSLCRVDFFDRTGKALQHYEITPDGYLGDDYFSPIELLDDIPEQEVDRLYREIGVSVQLLTETLGLKDYWAMDFRLDSEGCPRLIDLNTGAFPKGDAFGHHAHMRHASSFGQALVRAICLSHESSLKQPREE